MSDHQFQEREYEAGGSSDLSLHDLVSSLTGHSGRLTQLTEKDLFELGHGDNDAACPVCMTPLPTILAEEEMALAMDSPAHPFEELGVTRLWFKSRETAQQGCGHIFCRKCISKWIGGAHHSCPTCRRLLIQNPNSDSMIAPMNAGVEEALQQMHERLLELTSDDGGNDFTEPVHRSLEENQEDRRSVYSGMYL